MKKYQVGSDDAVTKDVRLSARPKGGYLGNVMNQGGGGGHESASTLPEMLAQGKSTKEGKDTIHPRGLKTLMGQ